MEPITIMADQYIGAMSKDNPPVLRAPSGSSLIFETNDCFHGQVESESQGIQAVDWERINPATGPVYIEGAERGDALLVRINQIEFTGPGVLAAIPDTGVFGGEVSKSRVKLMTVADGAVDFGHGIRLAVSPMVGVIGVAPEHGPIANGVPGSHGGNMDCTLIAPGNALYLPVFHPGGLLAMGDAHALMGDGEVMGCGVEIPARVHVTVELVKGCAVSAPIILTDERVYAIVSDDSLEAASAGAVRVIRDLVARQHSIDKDEAGMLLSIAGSLEICQIVDPKVTARFGISKEILTDIK